MFFYANEKLFTHFKYSNIVVERVVFGERENSGGLNVVKKMLFSLIKQAITFISSVIDQSYF